MLKKFAIANEARLQLENEKVLHKVFNIKNYLLIKIYLILKIYSTFGCSIFLQFSRFIFNEYYFYIFFILKPKEN